MPDPSVEINTLSPSVPGAPGTVVAPPPGRVGRRLRATLVALDLAAVAFAWTAVSVAPPAEGRVTGAGLARLLAVVLAAAVVALAVQRLYLARVSSVRTMEVARLARVAAAASATAVVAAPLVGAPLTVLRALAGGVGTFLLLTYARSAYDAWLKEARRRGRACRSVVLVGGNTEAEHLHRLLLTHPELGYRVVGVVAAESPEELGVPWLGPVDDAVAAVRSTGANGVLIASSAVPAPQCNALVRALLNHGVHVQLSAGLSGIDYRRVRHQPLAHEPFFYIEPATLSPGQLFLKRLLDVAVASLVLVTALPVLVVAALVIKLSDRGPVLFRQERVGRDGRPFTVYKLRTMVAEAETWRAELEDENQRDGPLFKLSADPRITRFGRFCRAASLDELPQLVNVLRGDMSLVGPRPALPSEVARFDDELQLRHRVRPGITGLWQVEARDNPAFHAYRRLDLFYVENWSVSLDLMIFVQTAQAVAVRVLRSLLPDRRPEAEVAVLD